MSDWYSANLILVQSTLTVLLLALSVQIPLRMGVFSFAGVGSYGLGGYAAAIAMTRFGWSTYPSIVLGVVLAGAIGYLLGVLIQRLSGLYLGMATISFDLIISVIASNGGKVTGGASGLYGAIGEIGTPQIALIVVVVLAALAISERGGMARRIEAVREDPELAVSMGVSVPRYRRATFLFSGLLGGGAGAIHVLLRSTVAPEDIGFGLVVLALTVIIVGGSRSWIGAVIGSVIFVWLPKTLDFVGEWEAVIYGAIVALAAIYIPGGIVGVVVDYYRGLQQGRRRGLVASSRAEQEEAAADADAISALDELTEDVTTMERQR